MSSKGLTQRVLDLEAVVHKLKESNECLTKEVELMKAILESDQLPLFTHLARPNTKYGLFCEELKRSALSLSIYASRTALALYHRPINTQTTHHYSTMSDTTSNGQPSAPVAPAMASTGASGNGHAPITFPDSLNLTNMNKWSSNNSLAEGYPFGTFNGISGLRPTMSPVFKSGGGPLQRPEPTSFPPASPDSFIPSRSMGMPSISQLQSNPIEKDQDLLKDGDYIDKKGHMCVARFNRMTYYNEAQNATHAVKYIGKNFVSMRGPQIDKRRAGVYAEDGVYVAEASDVVLVDVAALNKAINLTKTVLKHQIKGVEELDHQLSIAGRADKFAAVNDRLEMELTKYKATTEAELARAINQSKEHLAIIERKSNEITQLKERVNSLERALGPDRVTPTDTPTKGTTVSLSSAGPTLFGREDQERYMRSLLESGDHDGVTMTNSDNSSFTVYTRGRGNTQVPRIENQRSQNRFMALPEPSSDGHEDIEASWYGKK